MKVTIGCIYLYPLHTSRLLTCLNVCRHLLEQEGSEEAATSRFYIYQEGLTKLREMAEILINKRLIC